MHKLSQASAFQVKLCACFVHLSHFRIYVTYGHTNQLKKIVSFFQRNEEMSSIHVIKYPQNH